MPFVIEHHQGLVVPQITQACPGKGLWRFRSKLANGDAANAQLLGLWTENPCVGGSIPPQATITNLSKSST